MAHSTYKAQFLTATATIAEQADVINAQALRISELERLAQADGKQIVHLQDRESTLVGRLASSQEQFEIDLATVRQAFETYKSRSKADLVAAESKLEKLARELVIVDGRVDSARRDGEMKTRFRADVAIHILANCTLTQVIATDVIRVLNGESA